MAVINDHRVAAACSFFFLYAEYLHSYYVKNTARYQHITKGMFDAQLSYQHSHMESLTGRGKIRRVVYFDRTNFIKLK